MLLAGLWLLLEQSSEAPWHKHRSAGWGSGAGRESVQRLQKGIQSLFHDEVSGLVINWLPL